MNPADAPALVLLGSILALAVIALTAAIEAREEPLEWPNDAAMCPGCGSRRCHVSHPVRPWVDRGPR